MEITQKQIADKLGVTPVLVSRALSDHPSVAAATRARVREAARELGYHAHSNNNAKTLAARRHNRLIKTGVLAVTIPSNFDGKPVEDVPFFQPFFSGVGKEASERGLEICLCPIQHELPVRDALPRIIASRSVDGVLALGDVSLIPQLNEIGLPVVALDEYSDCAPHLVPDDRDGMKKATQHLIDLGHARIAYIGHLPEFAAARERFAGFQSALYDNNLPLDENLWQANLTHSEAEHGQNAMRELLEGGAQFSAVVCYHDLFAMGAMKALKAARRRVPGDVSIVGFDDVSTRYGTKPPVTSIAFDREAMGRRAVQMLCDEEIKGARREVFPVELVVRASTRRASK